jgi:hypothetical protein
LEMAALEGDLRNAEPMVDRIRREYERLHPLIDPLRGND